MTSGVIADEMEAAYERLCHDEDRMPYSVVRAINDARTTGDADVLYALDKFSYGDYRYPAATVISTTRALQRVGLSVTSDLSPNRIEAHQSVVKAYADCSITSSTYKSVGLAIIDLMHQDISKHRAVEELVKERCIINPEVVREMMHQMSSGEQPLSRGLL